MELPTLYNALRWLHVGAGTAWFGEVATINLVLVPALLGMSQRDQAQLLARIFPRLFKLASWLSGTAVLAGCGLLYMRFSGSWSSLLTTSTGLCFVAGGTLATLLTTFHFVVEPRLDSMICTAAEREDFAVTDRVVHLLKVIPRAGFGVITAIVLLMMVGARGF